MFEAFKIIPALQNIFQTEIEYMEDSFVDLTPLQLEAYVRKHGQPKGRLYRVLPIEPTVIDRQGNEQVTVELNIVEESGRLLALQGVAFVYRASSPLDQQNPSFEERLAYLRPRLPPIVIGEDS